LSASQQQQLLHQAAMQDPSLSTSPAFAAAAAAEAEIAAATPRTEQIESVRYSLLHVSCSPFSL
jgi:hypothetical protein